MNNNLICDDTPLTFSVVGSHKQGRGKWHELTTKFLSFETSHPLQAGMLLEMCLPNNTQPQDPLEITSEVLEVEELEGNSYRVSSEIKEIS